MANSSIAYIWNDARVSNGFVSGVSLHSHTNQSRETLDFLANFGNQYPFMRPIMARSERLCKEKYNFPIDYARSFWTPPLTPRLAFDLESRQIERLNLMPLVSISDHDNIQAPMLLRTVPSARHIPVSVEWTAPVGGDQAFHLGIHNLPSAEGVSWMETLAEYTENPSDERLTELLAALHALPNVLIVFNHPLWDLYLIGEAKHRLRVDSFLAKNSQFIHAFELNGLRDWDENRGVKHLARKWSKPLLSGGDRHGTEPNANINLTNATSFTEFVHEVRYQGISNVLFMNQYAEPWKHRLLKSTLDAIRDYPEFPQGSRYWDERVYHPDANGVIRPLRELWVKGEAPRLLRYAISMVRLMGRKPVSSSLRLAWSDSHQLRFALGDREAF